MRFILKSLGWLLLALLTTLLAFRIAAYVRETGAAPPQTTSFLATRYGNVAIQISGPETGPRVMLLHGTAAWSGFWRDVSAHLAGNGWRVIAVDTPPFGYSDRDPQERYSRIAQAERLADILKATGPATIVGHSFGAGAGVELALREPAKVEALVLVAAALGQFDPPPGENGPARLLSFDPLAQVVVGASLTNPLLTETLLRSFLHRKAAAAGWTDTLEAPMRREGSTSAYAAWLPTLLATADGALSRKRSGMEGIRVPVAVIWGMADTITPVQQGETIAALTRSKSTILLPDVGHIPHIEDPKGFLAALETSLAAVRDTKGK
jgi:pimeloyl-ACP methyl ester carboxylesterase